MNRILAVDWLASFVALIALASSGAAPQEPVPQSPASAPTPEVRPRIDGAMLARLTWVAPTHVWLYVPRGSVQDGTRASWTNEKSGVEFTVDESSDDYGTPEVLAEQLLLRRRKVVERREVRVAGIAGTLLVLEPLSASEAVQGRLVFVRQGGMQLALHFEAPRGRATSAFEDFVAEVLRETVWDFDLRAVPLAGFPWSVRLPAELSFLVGERGGARFVAPSGAVDDSARTSKEALLSISHLQPPPEIAKDEAAGGWRRATPREAAQRLLELVGAQPKALKVERPRESRALTIDGHEAWEIVARADTPSGSRPTLVYLAVIVADDFEVTFSALIREELDAKWLPRLRALVRSWKQSSAVTTAAPK